MSWLGAFTRVRFGFVVAGEEETGNWSCWGRQPSCATDVCGNQSETGYTARLANEKGGLIRDMSRSC